ncbi:hypothetical protein TWF281_000980 [Arthrobotrys megalospora]
MPPFPTGLKGAELKKRLVELASTSRPDKPLDIYVTSSTGHQIREDGGSGVTGWRDDRNQKLKTQFTNAAVVGSKRKAGEMVSETSRDLKPASNVIEESKSEREHSFHRILSYETRSTVRKLTTSKPPTGTTQASSASTKDAPKPKQIFRNCTIYINGNTSISGVSDVELKRLLTSHGAVVSYHLARRQVTHIILTNPSTASHLPSVSQSIQSTSTVQLPKTVESSGTAILSSRKIELEMKGRIKSKIHYVSVEWALASMKEERRLAETKFPVVPLREARQGTLMNPKKVKSGQRSLTDMMKR